MQGVKTLQSSIASYAHTLKYLKLVAALLFFFFAFWMLWQGFSSGHLINARTIHAEEYDEGFGISSPQSFIGINWPMKTGQI